MLQRLRSSLYDSGESSPGYGFSQIFFPTSLGADISEENFFRASNQSCPAPIVFTKLAVTPCRMEWDIRARISSQVPLKNDQRDRNGNIFPKRP